MVPNVPQAYSIPAAIVTLVTSAHMSKQGSGNKSRLVCLRHESLLSLAQGWFEPWYQSQYLGNLHLYLLPVSASPACCLHVMHLYAAILLCAALARCFVFPTHNRRQTQAFLKHTKVVTPLPGGYPITGLVVQCAVFGGSRHQPGAHLCAQP